MALWKGRYSRRELRRVCERLNINEPVRIQAVRPGVVGLFEVCGDPGCICGGGRVHTRAAHAYDPEAGEHLIRIVMDDDEMTVAEANDSMLHELAHASQMEECAGLLEWNFLAGLGEELFGYKNAPHEVEARRIAADLAPEFNITRSTEESTCH